MSDSSVLRRKWLRLEIRTWIFVILILALGFVIYGMFFVRRQIYQYRPAHTFSISSPEFFGSAHALADPVPLPGNKIQLLQNRDEIFPAMLQAIQAAQKSVNFEAYIFYSDTVGRQFRDALCERAQAGVRVRIILDGIGSSRKLDNKDVDYMKSKGCQFGYYHPTLSYRLDRTNRRCHRRNLIIDGKIGFTGGVGFADQWSGHAESPDHWRDTHARIEGPLVGRMQGAFQQHWLNVTKLTLTGVEEFPALAAVGSLRGQVVESHSYTIAPIPLVQAVAISAAEKRIWITNPYCTPTKDQIELLVGAVKRGVDVRLLVPGKHTDQPATQAAGRNSYGDLLRGGVKIFEYEPTMIHAKTMVVDTLFSMFGTSNLDARSSQLNEEIDITVYDGDFSKQMDETFEKDLQHAKPYTLEQFEKRGFWERTTETLMRPFQ